MRKFPDFYGLANLSLLHELEQQLDQQSILRMIELHQQLKYKKQKELLRIKKKIPKYMSKDRYIS